MKRIVTATVNNHSGVLNRITSLFSRRGYNIESITVGHTETPEISRMTFVVNVDDKQKAEQLTKQLNKQIDVIKVQDITEQPMVARELALIRVLTTAQTRSEITGLIAPFRATIVDVSKTTMVVQATGDSEKIEALIELLRPYGIKDIARTGTTAFTRGSLTKATSDNKPVSIIN
ncbi:acetolactate synthase small subunit [Bacillus solimangrovi]|uniref:Acetolactate synthase small subunit n=1 Tax=Bacillus solimangrovi TaxID=1305675 RepID=A0A1E5LBG3_9BACI|nr:acetolactate synthase small subunit [Bacillus solimangrovi]OEH91421.1 acetolactate synthase small subunit [Bacillus solimangrovi]